MPLQKVHRTKIQHGIKTSVVLAETTIQNYAKNGLGCFGSSNIHSKKTGICQNKCVKCQFLDLPSPTIQGYI